MSKQPENEPRPRTKTRLNEREQRPNRATSVVMELWNDLPDGWKNDPAFASLMPPFGAAGAAGPSSATVAHPSRAGDLSSVAACPQFFRPSTEPGKSTDLHTNISTATSMASSRSLGKNKTHGFIPSTDDDPQPTCLQTEEGSSPWIKRLRTIILLAIWLLFTVILMIKSEKNRDKHQISIPRGQLKSYVIHQHPTERQVAVTVEGAILPAVYGNLTDNFMDMWVELIYTRNPLPDATQLNNATVRLNKTDIIFAKNISKIWNIPLVSHERMEVVPEIEGKHSFELEDYDRTSMPHYLLRLQMKTNLHVSFPVQIEFDLSPINMEDGVMYAALVLLGLYVLIIFEVVHRTLAAMIASTMSVAILAALNERPQMKELIEWIDVETLLLLFSMMVLVAIFSETGIFDYLAVYAYKVTGGKVWPLINTLCFFTVLLSMVLDNVTTVLLMTPVSIRLCEVMELNPVPVLMSMIVYSNIGGAITPVGDPPNVLLASNEDVKKAGVDFATFTLHMGIGTLIVFVVVNIQLRFMFRNINDFRFAEPQDVQELRHEIAIWQRAAASLSSYSKDEDAVRETLLKKARRLLQELQRKLVTGSVAVEDYRATLEELQEKYPIRDKKLLIKSGLTILFVVILFFLHSIPQLKLSLGWTALLGAILLLILADQDMEGVLARVEWSTLLFFAALFILMEALSQLGLIDWIGRQTQNVILAVSKDYQLALAILLVLWVSAFVSSFVDNIPLTTMMVKIIGGLSQNEELSLPLQPLVWALAFGACLGGNGTLIGSSSNVVCTGVAEQHGYRFTFIQFFKVGFPIMVTSVATVSIYLMIAHVALEWNS